jgi:hypothetical protein
VAAPHEQAWADALALEHAHQQELLGTFRGELATFARECALTLTALDAYIGVLGGVVDAVNAARTGYQQATLAAEVARRLPGLAAPGPADPNDVALYDRLGDGDVPPSLVDHARALATSTPPRSDRELLQAVAGTAGLQSQLEAIVGPVPVAALGALKPLSRWASALATVRHGEAGAEHLLETARRDLAQVLGAAEELSSAEGLPGATDAATLADSLKQAADHAHASAKAIQEGHLQRVIAEAREQLEGDLAALRGVIDGAVEADASWRSAREDDHAELTDEVHEKLDRLDQIRGVLGEILPHLQSIGRALVAVHRVQALEGRLDQRAGVAVQSGRVALLLELSRLWETVAAPPARPERRRRGFDRRWLILAALVLVGAVVGIVLAVAGGGSKKAATTTTTTLAPTTAPTTTTPAPAKVPPAPKLTPVKATFVEADRATFYTVSVVPSGKAVLTYQWKLIAPSDNPTCNKLLPVAGKANEVVWHHASTDGCSHNGPQHLGTVEVTIVTQGWHCTATFFGTLTNTGPRAQRCRRG